MKVLLVEDEEHKANDLILRLEKAGIGKSSLTVASSVKDAVLAVTEVKFDLIVLDMALPTFSKANAKDRSGGIAQSGGGIEVLRTLNSAGISAKIVIVTQYPEIVINGESTKPGQVAKLISKRYNQSVIGTIIYSYNTPEWEQHFDKLMENLI